MVMKNKRIGIVLLGGSGTRFYPTTKAVNKHLLPIYNKPMFFYSLSTLMNAGIKDIMIITNGLSYTNLLTLFKQADGKGKPYLGLNFTFKVQIQPKGIAEALIIAEEWQGAEDVCLILGIIFLTIC